MSKRTVIIKPGMFRWAYKGMKVQGLDLKRFIKDVLTECGYPCVECDTSCDNPVSPNVLERLTALETASTTNNTSTAPFYDIAYPVANLTVAAATTIETVYIAGDLAEEGEDYTVTGNLITFTPTLTASTGSGSTTVDIVVRYT